MSWWRKVLGLPADKAESAGNSPSEMPKTPAASNFGNSLDSTQGNGRAMYAADRDEAFRWHAMKKFPNPGHNDVGAVGFFSTMSTICNDDSIWQEGWSGFHHALVGCLNLNLAERIPDICWQIGRVGACAGAHSDRGGRDHRRACLGDADALVEDL